MRLQDNGNSIACWISARETTEWARRWPCSTLAGCRIVAAFDRHGLYELEVFDGARQIDDVDAHEFSACVADHLKRRISADHPCYYVVVGQFEGGAA